MRRAVAWAFCMIVIAVCVSTARGFDDVGAHPACGICGMDRKAFGHSRMLIEFEDGTSFGACSLRCAAFVLRAEEGKKLRSVKVADYNTLELVDAEEALWVIGGKKPGVMTAVAKWAFRNEEDRERFVREFGGARAAYREALEAALKEL